MFENKIRFFSSIYFPIQNTRMGSIFSSVFFRCDKTSFISRKIIVQAVKNVFYLMTLGLTLKFTVMDVLKDS